MKRTPKYVSLDVHQATTVTAVLEPVDATVLSSDEAVEARRHMDRYARLNICHRFTLPSSALGSTARSHLRSEPAQHWS